MSQNASAGEESLYKPKNKASNLRTNTPTQIALSPLKLFGLSSPLAFCLGSNAKSTNMSSDSTTTPIAPAKDMWDSETYSKKVAPFVPVLTTRVLGMLDPKEKGE